MEEDWDEFYRKTKELMDKLFNEIMMGFEKILEEIEDNPDEMKAFGFRIEIGPDGVPKIYRFSSSEHKQRKPRVVIVEENEEIQEPFVDVYNEGEIIRIIAELPGVNEQDIKVISIDRKHILVEAMNSNRRFRKEVKLPTEIDVKSIEKYYRNGLLEIIAKRKQI
ncbi:MAG: Hsp20/alpha crystallin family protein [Ignisphaera sp.]